MKIQDHGNNLIQLMYYGFVNLYLLREDDGFTFIVNLRIKWRRRSG